MFCFPPFIYLHPPYPLIVCMSLVVSEFSTQSPGVDGRQHKSTVQRAQNCASVKPYPSLYAQPLPSTFVTRFRDLLMIQPSGCRRHIPNYIDRLQRSTCIWISDTALQSAWQSFSRRTFVPRSQANGRCFSCHCKPPRPFLNKYHSLDTKPVSSKPPCPSFVPQSDLSSSRHGSTVPGPLEARRRARRRLMGQCTPTTVQGGTDLGILMGINAQGKQRERVKNHPRIYEWYSPTERAPKRKEGSSAIDGPEYDHWSILSPGTAIPNVPEIPDRLSPRPGPPLDDTTRDDRDDRGSTLESEARPEAFAEDQHQLKMGHYVRRGKDSRMAFEQLTQSKRPLDVLLEFLSDKKLCPPNARNVTFLVRSLVACNVAGAGSDLARLEAWVEIEAKLGTLDELEICSILRAATTPPRDSPSCTQVPWSFCSRIWDGIDQSAVRTFDDLKQSTLMLFVGAAANAPQFSRGLEMGSKILLALSKAQPIHAEDRTAFLLAELSRRTYRDRDSTFSRACLTERVPQLLGVLQSLPESVISGAVVKLLSRLLLQTRSKNGQPSDLGLESLGQWLAALSKTNFLRDARKDPNTQRTWRNIDSSISIMGPKLLATYLSHFSDPKIARFLRKDLLPRWHISHVAETSVIPVSTDDYPRLRSDLLHNLDCQVHELQKLYKPQSPPSPYLVLIRAVRVKAPHLLNALLCTLLPLLRHQSKLASTFAILDSLARANTFAPLHLLFSEIANLAPMNPLLALTLWTMDPRPQMADCSMLPTLLSPHLTIHPSLLRRVYFRLRVAHSVPRNPCQPVIRPLTNTSAQMLELLAHHLAVCPALTHRQALRAVRRVLMLFRRNEEMLGPGMAKALTEAGIVRTLQAGRKVGIARKAWVEAWVVGLEGTRVWEGVDSLAAQWEAEIEERSSGGRGSN